MKIRLVSGLLASLISASALASTGPAPDCELTRLGSGTLLKIADLKGKVAYVDFWASWCGPCLQSFPFMSDTYKEFKPRGFELVAINLDEERESVEAFIAKHPADFTVATNPGGECPQRFEVQAMPSSFIIDRKGNIRHVHLGFHDKDKAEIRSQIDAILKEP